MQVFGQNITFVAGLHGNERSPVRALDSLGVEYVLGNPEAYAKNVRFIDEDLNASFGKEPTSLETRRAQELLDLIPSENLVVDFHTTQAVSEPFIILTERSMLPLAARTGCRYAVLMTYNIKEGHALINHRNGISVEITGHDTPEAIDASRQVIGNLTSGTSSPLILLEVFEKITEPGNYTNLVEHPEGFYPVLTGETSYNFVGLKARRIG